MSRPRYTSWGQSWWCSITIIVFYLLKVRDSQAELSKKAKRDSFQDDYSSASRVTELFALHDICPALPDWIWPSDVDHERRKAKVSITTTDADQSSTVIAMNGVGGTGDPMLVFMPDGTEYELIEPLHLELGLAVKHLSDYAYTPVITKDVEPIIVHYDSSSLQTHHDESSWWRYWLHFPQEDTASSSSEEYKLKSAFAGGSHGQVWRGKRKCAANRVCHEENLVFKRLKIEHGYRLLEAGLREVYFGKLLANQTESVASMYTQYVDHFFKENNNTLELWIVFRDAGSSLRSYLYSGNLVGNFVVYQPSELWMKLRFSVSAQDSANKEASSLQLLPASTSSETEQGKSPSALMGRRLMSVVLRQLLQAASFLHEQGIVHRDIKPSNLLCNINFDPVSFEKIVSQKDMVQCFLADFSSGWDLYSNENFYTRGASRLEQTDEYAPPEAIFGHIYEKQSISPAFDSWSIGILTLELLLGTPNVFTVDQRTRVILTQKMQRDGASSEEIQKSLYLAALSQFCIFDPSNEVHRRSLTPRELQHIHSVARSSCNMNDFHRALRARDPLGTGFGSSADALLKLVWDLLAFDPEDRLSASEALRHPYFASRPLDLEPGHHNALESLMLDPRMDFNLSDSVDEFSCPLCGRRFSDWRSCQAHARARNHSKFCVYDKEKLPSCLNAHPMLPTHYSSGYCDIQGRRAKIEDFHSIRLLEGTSFYGIFDGHNGNLASKYSASMLHAILLSHLDSSDQANEKTGVLDWKRHVEDLVKISFDETHQHFLNMADLFPSLGMEKSGTTATTVFMTSKTVIVAHLGDSRAILSIQKNGDLSGYPVAYQLTKDHVASDPDEKASIEARGGFVSADTGLMRVNGKLAVSRSLGDKFLADVLSHEPDVVVMSREEVDLLCGRQEGSSFPCILVLASDGLWDVMSNQEAIDMIFELLRKESSRTGDWRETAVMQMAAEALTQEAYVRGSTDNIGVCVVALD